MLDRRMLLTEAMNAGAHGHIHELLGGAWSAEWHGFYNRTEFIVMPVTHVIVVSWDLPRVMPLDALAG